MIRKRLMDEPRIKAGEKALDRMLLTLARGGFVTLEPRAARNPRTTGEPRRAAPAVRAYSPPAGRRRPRRWTSCSSSAAFIRCTGRSCSNHLGIADRDERLQALESVLEMPRPLLRYLRVPRRSAARARWRRPGSTRS